MHRYLAFYDGRRTIAHTPNASQHTVCLRVSAIVSHTANPSWRIKVHINRLFRKLQLNGIAYLLSFQLVVARISTGKNLHSITIDFSAATHHLFAHIHHRNMNLHSCFIRLGGCARSATKSFTHVDITMSRHIFRRFLTWSRNTLCRLDGRSDARRRSAHRFGNAIGGSGWRCRRAQMVHEFIYCGALGDSDLAFRVIVLSQMVKKCLCLGIESQAPNHHAKGYMFLSVHRVSNLNPFTPRPRRRVILRASHSTKLGTTSRRAIAKRVWRTGFRPPAQISQCQSTVLVIIFSMRR